MIHKSVKEGLGVKVCLIRHPSISIDSILL
ncbi:hypothetical protein LINGRAHAP2_LOCUS23481 [Linum grandiflorum]